MFDAQKSFEDNLAIFKAECEKIDVECTKILFDNINILIEHGSDRDARSHFNSKVKSALDTLPAREEKK